MSFSKTLGELGIKLGLTAFGWIASFIAMIIVMVVGNFLLVGGQHLWHKEDYAKLDSIKLDLEQRKLQIETLESNLKKQKNELDLLHINRTKRHEAFIAGKERLKTLEKSIKTLENTHPDGIPSNLFENYRASIDRFNREVKGANSSLAVYNADQSNYNGKVDAFNESHQTYKDCLSSYNEQVSIANAVSSRIGSTAVLVPSIGHRSRYSH